MYASTKREAQEKLREALRQADHNIRPVPQRATVGQWLDEWLTTSVEPRCRPRTVEAYRETVARYIAPAIGSVPLAKLEPEHVSRMLARLGSRPLSVTTIRYAHSVLRIALARALKSGRVLRNVATLVEPPARVRPVMRPLSAEQAIAFLDSVTDDRLGPLYSLAIATGMRQGELLALRWSDVDLDAATVIVRHTLQRRTRTLSQPKTDRARRTLRLGASAMGALREQRRRQLEERVAAGRTWRDGDFVFAGRTGDPLDSHGVTESLQRAGLPRQRFHDLRHAYATLMLEDGEELAVLSRTMGHADLSTTADVYAHLTPAMLQRSAARMDTILGRRREVG